MLLCSLDLGHSTKNLHRAYSEHHQQPASALQPNRDHSGLGVRAGGCCLLLSNPAKVSHSTTEKAGGLWPNTLQKGYTSFMLPMLKVSQQSWCSLPFSFFSLLCTYCFHLNNNLPITQHSQKNQTPVPEKQRPDSSVGFWMSITVNQWHSLKMSCRTRTEQQPVSAVSVIPLLWFTLYKYPNKQVCCQEYSGERQNVERSQWTLALNGEISSRQFDHRRCPGLPGLSVPEAGTHTTCLAQSHQEYAQCFLGSSQGNAYFPTVLSFWILK